LQDLIIKVFTHFMSIKNLQAKNLPDYPYGIGQEHEAWPKDPFTKQPLMRFFWKKDVDNKVNNNNIDAVVTHIRTTGATLVPEAKDLLVGMSNADVKEMVVTKWKYMSGQWKKIKKESDQKAEKERRQDATEDEEDQPIADDQKLSRAQKNSRAEAVSDSSVLYS
jgi:hypothetical protein